MATNYALTGTASASSVYLSNVAANGNNDNLTDRWQSSANDGWWKVDLGASKLFTKISVQTSPTVAYSFILSGSNDDITYTTIATGTLAVRSSLTAFSGFTQTYRYVKIQFNDGANWSWLAELQVWDESGGEFYGTLNFSNLLSISGTIMKGLAGDIDSNLVFPITIGGTIDNPIWITGSMPFAISIRGTMYSPVVLTGDGGGSLPHLTLSGTGIDSELGDTSIILPFLSLNSEGIVGALADGVFNIPILSVSGEGIISIIGNSLLVLPRLTLEAEGRISVIGNLSVNLPMFSLSAEALRGATGSLDQDIPPATLNATGILSCEGTGAVTIPVLTLTSTFILQSYLNMVMNIRNAALTLYDNYDFNSFCRFNGIHLGATSTRIYDLDSGITDAGTLIDWNFRTGYLDLHQKIKKKLTQAWISYKSDGNLILTVVQPNGEEYEYPLDAIDITESGIRAVFGKGIKSKYVALDISNVDGSDITLDVMKLQFHKTSKER